MHRDTDKKGLVDFVNINELLLDLLKAVIIVVVPILTGYLIKFLNAQYDAITIQTDSDQVDAYLKIVRDLIIDIVKATNQTFVDALKAAGSFDEAAQKAAFEKTKAEILNQLTDSGKLILTQVYGDLDAWLNAIIESTVITVQPEAF